MKDLKKEVKDLLAAAAWVGMLMLMIAMSIIVGMQRASAQGLDQGVFRPMPNVFILSENIGFHGDSYDDLVDALDRAKKGDTIYIVLRENNGGYIREEGRIRDAMYRSKALVVTEVQGWASSAALCILFSGDRIVIEKNVLTGVDHLSSPRSPWSMAEDIKEMVYHIKFLSAAEWQSVKAGKDTFIYGNNICAKKLPHSANSPKSCTIINNYR